MYSKSPFYWFVILFVSVFTIRGYMIAFPTLSIQDLIEVKTGIIRPGIPIHISIPSINLDTSIESIGMTSTGALAVPEIITNVGWLATSARPGEEGSAVIDGHYGWRDNIPTAFDNLHFAKIGDYVYIQDEKETVKVFIVKNIKVYHEAEKVQEVFTSSDGRAHLNLITCEGVWNKELQSYSGRLVVFTDSVL